MMTGETPRLRIIERHRKGLATKTEVKALVAEVEALRQLSGIPVASAEVFDWLTDDAADNGGST